ncbi:MAG TPA: hypothetical protein VJJ26_02745 [Candidatus Babeliales bacterium]|nr:hypothetical protein [Candidatus Babeliales bacterium]
MNKYVPITFVLTTFFAIGMDTPQRHGDNQINRRWSPITREQKKRAMNASDYAGTPDQWRTLAFHLSVDKKQYKDVASILLARDSEKLRKRDVLAQKLYATLTQPNIVGFTVSQNEAPLVSFNAIKAVAFDLAQRGNNQEFSYVLPDYTAGDNARCGALHSGGFISQVPSDVPIYHKLRLDEAIEKMDYEKVMGILMTRNELVSNYSLARKLHGIVTNKIHGVFIEDCEAQFISSGSLISTAMALAQFGDNDEFLRNLTQ